MRAKEIFSKKIDSPIRLAGRSIPKLFFVGLLSLLGTLSLASLTSSITVYAQQQSHALDSWSEALRTAQAKVEVATSPGAFGNGVPELQNLTPQELLFVFGVAAIGGVLTYTTYYSVNRSKGKGINDMWTSAAA